MNIAIVTSEFVTENNFDGGLANYTYRLAKSLLQLGHKPTVFVRSETNEKLFFHDIEIYRVDPIKSYFWLINFQYLNRLFFAVKWRLLKLCGLSEYSTEYLKIQSKMLNRRVVQVSNSTKFDIIHYSHLGALGFYRLKNIPAVARISSSTSLCHQYGGYGSRISQAMKQEQLEFQTLKKMDGVFGPSRMIASIVGNEIKREIEIIESPYLEESGKLDLSIYDKHLKGKKYLLFFGTISLIKGGEIIAEIIYDVLQQHPELHFVFAGKSLHSFDPAVSMIDYIKFKAKEHTGRVISFDKMPHSKLYPIIQNCLFCVLPSRIDNFPNTCIEAMAHGKITIGTFGNGFEQLIDQGQSGFLIHVNDRVELLKTINKVLNLTEEEKQRIENNAVKRIDELKPEKVVTQLIKFYTKTIENFN